MPAKKDEDLTDEELAELGQKEVVRKVRRCLKLGGNRDAGPTLSKKAQEEKQLEHWKDIFRISDKSGSGKLTFTAFQRMARKKLKVAERLVSDAELQYFFQCIDLDELGFIELGGFLIFLNAPQDDSKIREQILDQVKRAVKLSMWKQKMDIDELERRFYNSAEEGIFDMANSDGSLGPEEMRRFFRKVLKVTKHEAPDKNLVIAFKAMDEDGGGTLDADEFLEFIRIAIDPGRDRERAETYTPSLIGGMRGCLPYRAPQHRPGTMITRGTVSGAPFCMQGRETLPNGRNTMNTITMLRHNDKCKSLPNLRHSLLDANGLPLPPNAHTIDSSGRLSTTLPSLGSGSRSSGDSRKGVSKEMDKYSNKKKPDALTRVQQMLSEVGIL